MLIKPQNSILIQNSSLEPLIPLNMLSLLILYEKLFPFKFEYSSKQNNRQCEMDHLLKTMISSFKQTINQFNPMKLPNQISHKALS